MINNVEQQKKLLAQQIEETKKQIAKMQEQLKVELKQKIKDTTKQIENTTKKLQEAQTQETIKETQQEIDTTKKEAEDYYGYTLPTDKDPYQYPEMEAEITETADIASKRTEEDYQYQLDEIGAGRQKLLDDYTNYLEDIKTGRLRVGEDKQIEMERMLEQQKEYLAKHEMQVKQNLENLHRGWMSRGATFAGPRFQSAQRYQSAADLEKQSYLSSQAYAQQGVEKGYQRTMEDYGIQQSRLEQEKERSLGGYLRQEQRYGQTKERSLEDITRGKIQDVRSLQQTFQEAVGRRLAQTLQEKYV